MIRDTCSTQQGWRGFPALGATEELTGLAPRSQRTPTTATKTRSAPTPPVPSHARATRATTALFRAPRLTPNIPGPRASHAVRASTPLPTRWWGGARRVLRGRALHRGATSSPTASVWSGTSMMINLTPRTGRSARSAMWTLTRTKRGSSSARPVPMARARSMDWGPTRSRTASAWRDTRRFLMGSSAPSACRGRSRLRLVPGSARLALREQRARRQGQRSAISATRRPIRSAAKVAVAALLRGRANLARVRQSRPDSGLNFHVKVLNATLETTSGPMASPQKCPRTMPPEPVGIPGRVHFWEVSFALMLCLGKCFRLSSRESGARDYFSGSADGPYTLHPSHYTLNCEHLTLDPKPHIPNQQHVTPRGSSVKTFEFAFEISG